MPNREEHGALTEAVFYILLSLYSPLHGYGIMQNVKKMSSGRVELGAGTLYGAISALIEKQWIIPQKNKEETRKKEYLITELGKSVIAAELERLRELLENGEKVTGGLAE